MALDFVNTISWRGTPRETDHIASTPELLAWAAEAGLIGDAAPLSADPGALIARAHLLRRALRGVFEAAVAGSSGPDERAILLRIATDCLASAELTGIPARLRYKTGEDAILGGLAWAAIELVGSDRIHRVKICQPEDCRWIFLDTSKNGSRRWCDMAACGTRAKVAQHRVRQRMVGTAGSPTRG